MRISREIVRSMGITIEFLICMYIYIYIYIYNLWLEVTYTGVTSNRSLTQLGLEDTEISKEKLSFFLYIYIKEFIALISTRADHLIPGLIFL